MIKDSFYHSDNHKDSVFGWSEMGKPLRVSFIGSNTAPLRLLIMAGQHGDEVEARVAVKNFLQMLRSEKVDTSQLLLAIISNLNPDGAAKGTRENVRGLDLNRDHQLLHSVENQALHCFIRHWRPHLIVDVHTYPTRRKHLLKHNLIYCHDIFVDIPTNPSLAHPMLSSLSEYLLKPFLYQLNTLGYRSQRYMLINRSGRIRHSTPDAVDARNGLTLRYGIPTILLEGRQPLHSDSLAVRMYLVSALQASLELLVQWAKQNKNLLTLSLSPLKPKDSIAISSRYVQADEPCRMVFKDAQSGDIRQVELPGKFTPQGETTKQIKLPWAYAVPGKHTALIKLLRRHGFAEQAPRQGQIEMVESYQINEVQRSKRANRPPRNLSVTVHREQKLLNNYVLFPVMQDGGHALAVLLEPESKYGLTRFPRMDLNLRTASNYPILRVPSEQGFG